MAYVHTKRAKNSEAPEVTEKYYLSNSKLLPEVLKSKAAGKMSNELAKMLMMLTRKYAQRPNFSRYTYKEDMIAEALINLCQNSLKFNELKSNNPFSFYTSCIHNSFIQFLNNEKKHRKIRDELLIDIGENPSFNFNEEHKQQSGENADFKSELDNLKNEIEDAKIRIKHDKELDAAKAAAKAAELGLDIEEVEIEDVEITDRSSLLDYEEDTFIEEHEKEFTGELQGFHGKPTEDE